MKKTILKKLFTFLLITILFVFQIMNYQVYATSNHLSEPQLISIGGEAVNEISTETFNDEEGTILQYDATTGKTSEVDMNKLRNKIIQMYSATGERTDRIEPFDPLACEVSKTSAIPYSSTFYKVSNREEFPYRVTCRISVEVYGKYASASGFLVGPNLLLTSAHCVMNREDNDNLFAQWTACPAYSNGLYKGIQTGWSRIIYPENWKKSHKDQDDWCICILNDDIGSQVGWYGAQAYGTNGEMNNLSVRALGYPTNPGDSLYQYYTYGNLSSISSEKFDTSSKIVKGMSGGPIARTSDNYAVGITKGFYTLRPDTGIGVRITQQIIDLLLANS